MIWLDEVFSYDWAINKENCMKKIFTLLVMCLASISFAGHHEATDNQIIFTINADIVEGKAESFKSLLKEMVPAVKA